jgi:uncharacterized heparinase superfamily protein
LITDHIDGPFNRAKIYFHIHPSIKVSLVNDGKYGFFVLPDGSKILWESTAESLKLQENLYSMEFGKRLPMRTIVLELKSSNEAVFSIKWN